MNALTFQIHLLEPLLITQPGSGAPDIEKSLNYIPGSVLRGALISRYRREHKVDLANDKTARHLFLDGTVRYLNAYPFYRGQRLLPKPLSWHIEKEQEDEIYDFAVELPSNLKEKEWKKAKGEFCYPRDDNEVMFQQVERQINIHIYRSKRDQQTKHEDSVFRYEALAAGQTFGAVIVADNPDDLERLKPLLTPPDLSIGGSHRAGYGRVEIQDVKLKTGWREYGLNEEMDEDDFEPETLIVTCLSDVLFRNDKGIYTNVLEPELPPEKMQKAFTSQHLVGGFNRKWGLPLPQAQAIQAGSVFVYKYDQVILQQLRQLEATGIGERRAEGFGRIAVNWQRSETYRRTDTPSDELISKRLNGASADVARQISERILRARLDDKLVVALSKRHIKPQPTNTQLARLRLVIRDSLSQEKLTPKEKLQTVAKYLSELKSTAASQFDRAKIENQSLRSWLEKLLNKPEEVWITLDASDESRPSIGHIQAEHTKELACEYTLRLIYGLLQRAGKGGNDGS